MPKLYSFWFMRCRKVMIYTVRSQIEKKQKCVVFVNDTGNGFVIDSVICCLCQRHQRQVCARQCNSSFLSTTPAVGLSLTVLFIVFVNDGGGGFVIDSVICFLCQRHQRQVCPRQCNLSFLSTTPAVGLSLTVLFIVFVKRRQRWVCHWQYYLSSLSMTPVVGLSLAVFSDPDPGF